MPSVAYLRCKQTVQDVSPMAVNAFLFLRGRVAEGFCPIAAALRQAQQTLASFGVANEQRTWHSHWQKSQEEEEQRTVTNKVEE